MAERMDDGGGTKVEQAEQPEPAEPERAQAVEPERRPTYRTLDEQQGRLTETEERFDPPRQETPWAPRETSRFGAGRSVTTWAGWPPTSAGPSVRPGP